MAERNLILSLAKVLISAAWADGKIDPAELNCLKDLLFGLKHMTASDWAELEIYLADPIEPREQERLLDDLRQNLHSGKDKQLALQMLNDIVIADGEMTDEEQAIKAEIENSIREAGTGILAQFGKLLQGPIDRRESKVHPELNREQYLEDFLRNRIYYHLKRSADQGEIEITLPEKEVRKLSLAGGLLARIAAVDSEITTEEQRAMSQALENKWNLEPEAAESVVKLAVAEIESGLDFFRLSREFFVATTREERIRFVEALFQIGYSDGKLSHEENEEIRHVANGLKLTHRQFIDAKLSAKP
jgi:uncharacterized tellurite resistance protein B-like protein